MKAKSATLLPVVLSALLLCVLAINSLSAYIRHVESGAGCEPWPACFGVVADQLERASDRTVLMQALTPQNVAKKWHRALVTVMVLLLAGMLMMTTGLLTGGRDGSPVLLDRTQRKLSWWLVLVVIVLAVIGPASYMKTVPLIALANLLGGIALLALTWSLLLSTAGTQRIPCELSLVRWCRWGVRWMVLQIALGAWVSANFVAPACSQMMCSTLSGGGVQAFSPLRVLKLDEFGRVAQDGNAWWINTVHRGMAMALGAYLFVMIYRMWRRIPAIRSDLLSLALLLITQLVLGVITATQRVPLNVVLSHHLTASVVLLCLLRISYRLQWEGSALRT